MSQTLTIELSDEMYAALVREAAASGQTPEQRVRSAVERDVAFVNGTTSEPAPLAEDSIRARIERHYPGVFGPPDTRSEGEKEAARQAFRRTFGSVRSGDAYGSDNDRIDADLAREYQGKHEAD
jgi:hypothetical protein